MHETDFADVLRPFVDNGTLAGAVTLVATKDGVLHHDAVGFADIAARKPMTKDALFWVASQAKPVTATAFMMLVDEGKVGLDDPVEKYLPEFAGQMVIAEQDDEHVLLRRPRHAMKVREILSHTSGLPFRSPLEDVRDVLTLRQGVKSNAMLPLAWEPGTRFEYSNAGINAAGCIIEGVSGMAYEEFLRTRLLGPLGMKDTTFRPDEEQVRRLVKIYKPGPDNTGLEETRLEQYTYPLTGRGRHAVPGGGLFSTAQDCARFCRMVLNGGELDGRRYLSEAAVKQMTSKQTGDGIETGYGFGWVTADGIFGHAGAGGTSMNIDPQRGLITVFLAQHLGFPGEGGRSRDVFEQRVNSLKKVPGS